jgi:hypothetical protein
VESPDTLLVPTEYVYVTIDRYDTPVIPCFLAVAAPARMYTLIFLFLLYIDEDSAS